MVQDLRAVSEATKDIDPVVPNPCTLLATLLSSRTRYSVLDLKDAFLRIPLTPTPQEIFAFGWQGSNTQQTQQYCWAVLPQGFKNSPTIFGETLAKDLKDLHPKEATLFQYADHILITSPTKEAPDKNTVTTPNHLAAQGYNVSKKKGQISQTRVTYLGLILRSLPWLWQI